MNGVYLRLGASVLALVAGASAIVVSLLLLRSTPPPASTVASPVSSASGSQSTASVTVPGGRIATPYSPSFPSPPENAVVLSREAGIYALAVALAPQLVRASVVAPSGFGAKGLDVRLAFGSGAPVSTTACGPGCYQLARGSGSATQLSVWIGKTAYAFQLPAAPTDGTAIAERATTTWKALKSVIWHERLASSPTDVIHTVYEAVAPDELTYTIAGSSSAVIIGTSRWDRSTPNGEWAESPQDPPITQPTPFWSSTLDAHVLGSEQFHGHAVWRVSFFDPATPAWFTAEIDKQTYRTLGLDMIAASHFMHHVYGPFDTLTRINPPPTA